MQPVGDLGTAQDIEPQVGDQSRPDSVKPPILDARKCAKRREHIDQPL